MGSSTHAYQESTLISHWYNNLSVTPHKVLLQNNLSKPALLSKLKHIYQYLANISNLTSLLIPRATSICRTVSLLLASRVFSGGVTAPFVVTEHVSRAQHSGSPAILQPVMCGRLSSSQFQETQNLSAPCHKWYLFFSSESFVSLRFWRKLLVFSLRLRPRFWRSGLISS